MQLIDTIHRISLWTDGLKSTLSHSFYIYLYIKILLLVSFTYTYIYIYKYSSPVAYMDKVCSLIL